MCSATAKHRAAAQMRERARRGEGVAAGSARGSPRADSRASQIHAVKIMSNFAHEAKEEERAAFDAADARSQMLGGTAKQDLKPTKSFCRRKLHAQEVRLAWDVPAPHRGIVVFGSL